MLLMAIIIIIIIIIICPIQLSRIMRYGLFHVRNNSETIKLSDIYYDSLRRGSVNIILVLFLSVD